MSIFLSASAIFLRLDFTTIYVAHREQPGQLSITLIVDITLDSCKIWAQKNGAGAQKNARIFKSNAPTWLKLGVGLDHMYTNGWNFLDPSV